MTVKPIDIIFPVGASDEELTKLLKKVIKNIEENGGKIVGGEPIEEIITTIVGKTFFVETQDELQSSK